MHELLERLNQTIRKFMGTDCDLRFEEMATLNPSEWNNFENLFDVLEKRPLFVENVTTEEMGFPIYSVGSFKGLAVITNFKGRSTGDLRLFSELIAAVLENGIGQQQRRDNLAVLEERMQVVKDDKKVIPLRPSRNDRAQAKITPIRESVEEAGLIGLQPLLILSTDSFLVHKIAVEAHQMLKRFALLNVEDLPATIFDSREGLEELGGITILIRDLTKLTTAQQVKLAEYLATEPAADMPLVIASMKPIETSNGPADFDDLDSTQDQVLPHLIRQFFVTQVSPTDKISVDQLAFDLIDAGLRVSRAETVNNHVHGAHVIPFHTQYFDPDGPVH